MTETPIALAVRLAGGPSAAARALGVIERSVRSWTQGTRRPSEDHARRLCDLALDGLAERRATLSSDTARAPFDLSPDRLRGVEC